MHSLPRHTALIAALGGLLWTVKALAIAANDGSVDPVESVLFIGGLACLLAGSVLVSLHLSRRLGGIARVAGIVAGTAALIAVTVLLETLGKGVVAGLAMGDNLGFEEEGGILVAGLAWLTLGGVALARARRAVPGAALA